MPLKSLILSIILFLITAIAFSGEGPQEKFPPIRNTQNPKDQPPSPREAAAKITVPDGFKVTLFAGEPDVQQPIAMNLDDRGRLWVAESYTYAADNPGGKRWDKTHRDRVIILEDVDNDGQFDKRKVFWDQARNLSGITHGFGGVWLLCAPNLIFVPDRNGDDVPDGEPQVVLDGWVVKGVGHNIVNGLTWGPDGWLYGRHGIMATSHVGRPGAAPLERVKLNCAIWRYHPTRKVFEVVTHGTTNPWGFDYDDHGQMFFTNNVIGHLWHVIPGAHYKRMYGEDFNSHVYELINQHADHYHWDNVKSWTDSRNTKGKHGELGGGHSHCGGMIYLGDNWPAKYRNTMFMCNTHGRRVNNDRLVRKGSGYAGVHTKDFMFANNPWFRGVDLKYGPDGGVYISDWTDLGECHDHDGVHRTSGRIYKVIHGNVTKPKIADVAKLSNAELVRLQLHKNDWYVRIARRVLQERAARGKNVELVRAQLHQMYNSSPDVTRKLRAMWCLHVTGGLSDDWLYEQLKQKNEHIRVWAVRLLTDVKAPPFAVLDRMVKLAATDDSGLVALTLASALQRIPEDERYDLAVALAQRRGAAADHNLPLMIWYGVEPMIAKHPELSLRFLKNSQVKLLRRFAARRSTEEIGRRPRDVEQLLELATEREGNDWANDILRGMYESLQGRRKVIAPQSWPRIHAKLAKNADGNVRELTRKLGVIFGDGRALAELRRVALDGKADGSARRAALQTLIEGRPDDLKPMLLKLLQDRATIGVAVKGLAAYDDAKIPQVIINRWRFLKKEDRPQAVTTLAARPAFARKLLNAVKDGAIDRADISAYHARQILNFNDAALSKQLSNVWGEIRTTPAAKRKLIAKYKQVLTGKSLQSADMKQGRLLFSKHCGNCHKLYGEGKIVGPDLTGSNRHNLDYLLENLIDPSAVVPVDFKMSVIVLKNGQVLNGVVTGTGKVVNVQLLNEKKKVDRDDVDEIRGTAVSLMPDGLLTPLSMEQVRDLFGYVMSQSRLARDGKR